MHHHSARSQILTKTSCCLSAVLIFTASSIRECKTSWSYTHGGTSPQAKLALVLPKKSSTLKCIIYSEHYYYFLSCYKRTSEKSIPSDKKTNKFSCNWRHSSLCLKWWSGAPFFFVRKSVTKIQSLFLNHLWYKKFPPMSKVHLV